MRYAGLGGGFVPQGTVDIEMRPLHQAGFISARPGQQQAEEIGFVPGDLIGQHFQQLRHLVRLHKPLPRVLRKFLDATRGIFLLVGLPVFRLHIH